MNDDAMRGNRQPVVIAEITWDKLDLTKYYVLGVGMFTGVSVMLYPIAVVKTRLQVGSHDAVERNAFSVIKGILKNDGIPGLYRGFGIVTIGSIPARILFLTVLERSKVAAFKMIEPLRLSQPTQAAVANGVAGMVAATCSQAVFVPIDVVSQRMIVQGYSGHATYSGSLDLVRKIIKSDGIQGLYKGFGLSVMTYTPSSAMWWASYGASQHMIWRLLGHGTESSKIVPSESKLLLVQASGGEGFCSCYSFMHFNPIGCYKNLTAGHEQKPTIKQVARNLIAEDGWTGLYRGLGARFCSIYASLGNFDDRVLRIYKAHLFGREIVQSRIKITGT